MSQNYKDTLLLPKTNFPMKADLVVREPERLAKWEASGLYERVLTARKGLPKFVLHDGPPFANGDVHMGTALNKVLKDLIVKSRSMAGFEAPFVPGWDCHGLPIEFKVVKESRGLAPAEIRRRSEEYARKFIEIQRSQFKRLGVLGDWQRPYLTLDPGYEAEILRAFAGFVEKGLVYQSRKPVYWSTGAQTALAEAEVEYADRRDPAIHVAFRLESGPLAGRADAVIWTTTPWTLPANVAIALHPRETYSVYVGEVGGQARKLLLADKLASAAAAAFGAELVRDAATGSFSGSDLNGSEALHPFLERRSRLIVAEYVTMDSGTGLVHTAPGHGADDYISGVNNGLPILSPVDEQGRYTGEVGVEGWEGKYVFDANADVIALLRGLGVLLAETAYEHSYPHCWRSKTPVVFRAVEQFFIRVDAIRGQALEEIDRTEWVPAWGRNRIRGTVESRPDWCISRQRCWGVPLPVFYDDQKRPMLDAGIARRVAELVEHGGTNLWFEKDDAWWCGELGLPEGYTRRGDTLDVWIDSGVSHEAVLRRNEALHAPADVYIEATDQHRGWFQSSLMTAVALRGRAPYRTVITHGFVVDKDTRKKVSKSAQGTYVKPMDAAHFVGKYGADVVRLWAASVEFTHEVPFSEESFAVLTDAYRQFRNVLRILLANLHDVPSGGASLQGATTVDRWMLSRLQAVIEECRTAYAGFDFRKVFQVLNQFCTVDLSAIYVDVTKDRMYCDAADAPRRRATQAVMAHVFDALCRLLAPVIAFTSDEAWEHAGREGSVHEALFPDRDSSRVDAVAEARVDRWMKLRALVAQGVETARQNKLIGNALEAVVTVETDDATLEEAFSSSPEEAEEFLILSQLRVLHSGEAKVVVERNPDQKCQRCWRYRPSVGASSDHPGLCARCEEVVA